MVEVVCVEGVCVEDVQRGRVVPPQVRSPGGESNPNCPLVSYTPNRPHPQIWSLLGLRSANVGASEPHLRRADLGVTPTR
eukprot:137352-Prorocentrum_minimum.AAC.1